MKKLTYILSILIVPAYLAFLSGCATMSQSECQVANWEIIGLEDAAAGRASSYIGQHRSACADYGVSPDLNAYMRGYDRGLAQFCTYENGLSLGSQGRGYAGICKGSAANQFLSGYNKGKRDYELRRQISSLKSEISRMHSRLRQIDIDVDRKENAIVASGTTPEARRSLLADIEALREEKLAIELDLPHIEAELFRLEDEYSRIPR